MPIKPTGLILKQPTFKLNKPLKINSIGVFSSLTNAALAATGIRGSLFAQTALFVKQSLMIDIPKLEAWE